MAARNQYAAPELTAEQVVELAGPLETLRRSDGWAKYEELIAGLVARQEALIAEGSKDDFDFGTGVRAGLKRALTVVDEILRAANVVEEREEAIERAPVARRRRLAGMDEGSGPSFG